VNAFSADSGGRVIEEHTETGTAAGRHEELYVVLRGRARFQLDGDEITAPAGTFVFVSDQEVERGAFAEEDGTTVLVLGGQAGVAYEVSPWEAAADAYPFWERGELDTAIEILRGVVEEHPRAGVVLYNLACAESLAGRKQDAIEHLRRSIEVEERFRDYARGDEDFAALRDDEEFKALTS
jgi:tetratricopeptide (TPR) repeat protein